MACDNSLDKLVKNQLIEDTVRLVNPLPFDREILRSELMKRKEYLDVQKKRPYANPTAMFKNHQEALQAKKTELNAKLSSILKGNVPRMYGEMPKHLGKFERIAPGTKLYDNAVKLRRLGLAGRKAEMKKGGIKRFDSTVSGGGGSSTRRRRRALEKKIYYFLLYIYIYNIIIIIIFNNYYIYYYIIIIIII